MTGTYTIAFSAAGYIGQGVGDVAVTAGQATEGVNAVLDVEPAP